ncbi:MAG: hypothetical protein IT479_05900 [Xanthomonadales bacterium]|nr:hypothetical protein [Xanthomonadales bacterium]
MLANLTEALGTLVGHASRLLWRVLSRVAGFLLLALAINAGALLWVGAQSWIALGAPLVIAALSLPAYLVVGWRTGIGAAIDEVWRTLGAPLREEVASRVVGQLQQRSAAPAQKLAAMADTVAEVRARLAGQRWWLRKTVELLLARVPWAQAIDLPALQQRLAGAADPGALQRIVREQLDRVELPSPLAWVPWALVSLHLAAMSVGVGAAGR